MFVCLYGCSYACMFICLFVCSLLCSKIDRLARWFTSRSIRWFFWSFPPVSLWITDSYSSPSGWTICTSCPSFGDDWSGFFTSQAGNDLLRFALQEIHTLYSHIDKASCFVTAQWLFNEHGPYLRAENFDRSHIQTFFGLQFPPE